jgi:hypothetical protein
MGTTEPAARPAATRPFSSPAGTASWPSSPAREHVPASAWQRSRRPAPRRTGAAAGRVCPQPCVCAPTSARLAAWLWTRDAHAARNVFWRRQCLQEVSAVAGATNREPRQAFARAGCQNGSSLQRRWSRTWIGECTADHEHTSGPVQSHQAPQKPQRVSCGWPARTMCGDPQTATVRQVFAGDFPVRGCIRTGGVLEWTITARQL